MSRRPQPWTVLLGVGALIGLFFASVSTYDFVMHLDRQVHDVHCSFVPGAGPASNESGCQVTMVSSYSSLFRTSVWGGVPISLPAMAVFAFLLAFAVELTVTDRQRELRSTGFAALATALPALTSIVMGYISLVKLGATCKLCIGIYVASALCLAGGLGLFIQAWRRRDAAAQPGRERAASEPILLEKRVSPRDSAADRSEEPAWVAARNSDDEETGSERPAPAVKPAIEARPDRTANARPAPVTWGYLAAAFGVGVLFVVLPMIGYVSAAPKHERFIGTCGTLTRAVDPALLVSLDRHQGEPPVIEVLDPLCPACLGFERRLAATGLTSKMSRKAVLFPLDDSCNWMVDSAIHPGACVVSAAMLCAGDRGHEVLEWSFRNQQAILTAAKANPAAAKQRVLEAFPALASCVDSQVTKAKLTRSLHWAVANRLPVMTPQLYVDGVKLCEEDVDLGLDYMLSRMLAASKKGTLPRPTLDKDSERRFETAAGDDRAPARRTAPAPTAVKPTNAPSRTAPESTDTTAKPSSPKPDIAAPAQPKPTTPPPPAATRTTKPAAPAPGRTEPAPQPPTTPAPAAKPAPAAPAAPVAPPVKAAPAPPPKSPAPGATTTSGGTP